MNQNVVPLVPNLNSHQERRKREINDRIKEAGIQLFIEQGYEPTTIEQICERADVARRTFYKHFLSKQHLAHALSESWMFEQSSRTIEEACAHSENAIERVRFYIERSANNLRTYEALERLLISHAMQDVTFDDRAIYRWTHQSGMLKPLIELGQARGEVSRAYDPVFLSKMVAGGLNTLVVSWIYEDNFPVAEQLAELANFMTAALRPAP